MLKRTASVTVFEDPQHVVQRQCTDEILGGIWKELDDTRNNRGENNECVMGNDGLLWVAPL